MINPIYRFDLSVGIRAAVTVHPVYGSDLSLNWTKESGQRFFRASLSGELTFVRDDFERIRSAAFDTEFILQIYISRDLGASWSSYWRGNFYKTDCKFDEDDKTVTVTPSTLDQYNDFLDGIDHEYNLIDLLPEARLVGIDKRPMVQVYTPGEGSIGCFMGGMYWETECDKVENDKELVDKYHFMRIFGSRRIVIDNITGNFPSTIPREYEGKIPEKEGEAFEYTSGGYSFKYTPGGTSQDGTEELNTWQIIHPNGGVVFEHKDAGQYLDVPYTIKMETTSSSGLASGTVDATLFNYGLYSRLVCDVERLTTGLETFDLPLGDICANNRNYRRVVGIDVSPALSYSDRFSSTPTKWGLYAEGQYYDTPDTYWADEWYPVAKSFWSARSLWIGNTIIISQYDKEARKRIILRDAYPLSSVISVLLKKIAPSITHLDSSEYSSFLYGTNSITNIRQFLLITPKSNIINSGYDTPAKNAPITLRDVLDMLRDCFKCYWFIDDANRLRIEHVSYFDGRGGTGSVGGWIDLTTTVNMRNGKPWSFGQNSYEFDKPETVGRYQFGWSDEQTEIFNGYPIEIISGYVQKDVVEEISVRKFSADVDYIMLNPSNVSSDGFALLSAQSIGGEFALPYKEYTRGLTTRNVQNGWLPFTFLFQYYLYDLPSWNYEIDGKEGVAKGTQRIMRQEVSFPCYNDIVGGGAINTGLGSGYIERISINLSSRNAKATLLYDSQ